ncbi:chaplin family protein [Streptomyces sp. CA-132043]|uniref:chaplin n=1 Tax=Streptomyces sp. CA-132043 TaxID=3240048 RepID=UPI003D8C2185
MRQVLAKGLLAAAATTGVLGVTGGTAFADAGASGESGNSPGVLSGNTVQAPVELPANACGNSVDVVGGLNPAFGNGCASDGGGDNGNEHAQGAHEQRAGGGGSSSDGNGASATGSAQNSPGVGSGNNAQAPVDVPVNACGNSADVVGLLNPVFGNSCDSSTGEKQHAEEAAPDPVPETHTRPAQQERPAAPRAAEPEVMGAQLAHTGTAQVGLAAGTGAALVLGGAILYRRARTAGR